MARTIVSSSLIVRTIITIAWISCYVIGQEDVRIPPNIISFPKHEIIYKQGDRVDQLKCIASGIPEPTYTWYKDDVLLEIRDKVAVDPPGSGNIIIDDAAYYLVDGNYTCKAANKYGTALSAKVQVKQAKIQFTSRTEPVTKVVNLGESLILEPFDKISSYPEAYYKWKTVIDAATNEGQKILVTTPRIALHPVNGKLYFAHVQQEDVEGGKIYKMDMHNAIEDVTRGGSPYVIKAIPAPISNKQPSLLTPSNENYDIVGIKGKNVTLKCFFGGYPTPRITWRQPANPPPQSRIDCTQEHNTECLIRSLQYSDSGAYRCQGENAEGKGEAKFNLIIESIPSFTTAPQNVNATEGDAVTFKCIPDAKPEALIEWFSNGVLIDPTDPGSSKLVISKDRTELMMRDICKNCEEGNTRSDLQVFMCRISNKHGEAFASAYLNVLEATTIYETSEQIVELDPSTGEPLEANFTCKSKTDPLMKRELDQAWWHNNGRLYGNSGHYIIGVKEQSLYVNLTELNDEERRDYVGEYECKPYTKYSAASVIFKLVIKGIKPRGTTFADVWWILLILLLLLLLILLCVCCCCYLRRNRGEGYPVDEKERANGNDPEKELKDMDFHEHHSFIAR